MPAVDSVGEFSPTELEGISPYQYVGAGSAVFDGIGEFRAGAKLTMEGSIVFDGTLDIRNGLRLEGTGGITFRGFSWISAVEAVNPWSPEAVGSNPWSNQNENSTTWEKVNGPG